MQPKPAKFRVLLQVLPREVGLLQMPGEVVLLPMLKEVALLLMPKSRGLLPLKEAVLLLRVELAPEKVQRLAMEAANQVPRHPKSTPPSL